MSYTGKNFEAFMKIEASWKDGLSVATPAADHIAFNPIEEFEAPIPTMSVAQVRAVSSTRPYLTYTEKIEVGDGDISTIYRDPFLMAAFFTNKTVTPLVGADEEVTTITTVADVAGSLNNTFFLFDTPTVDWYVWFNINAAGADPAVAGRTGIEVAGALNITANDLAAAIQVAVAGSAALVTCTNPGAPSPTVVITNDVAGVVGASIDGAVATGFTFVQTQASTWGNVDITMSFANANQLDTIAIQYHIDDEVAADDEDRTLIGGEIHTYKLECEANNYLKETATIKFSTFADAVQAFVPEAGFDDGTWSTYDLDTDDLVHATDVSLVWNALSLEDNGLEPKSWSITLQNERIQEFINSLYESGQRWCGEEIYEAEIGGYLTDQTLMDEVDLPFESKTKADLVISWDGGNKVITITQMFVDMVDNRSPGKANEAVERSFTFKGGNNSTASVAYTVEDKPDPNFRITT